MSTILLAALLLLFQAPPQEEKKPDVPQEEKKQDDKKPDEKKPEQEKPPAPEPTPDQPAEERSSLEFQADLRIGGWRTGSFDAQTGLGRRKIESSLLFDAGLDLRLLYSGWSVALTGDYGSGHSMKVETAGLLLGGEFSLAPDLDLQVAVGPIFGKLDVDVAQFGDFKSAVGFEARVGATTWVNSRLGVSLWVDYRQISFKYDEPVLTGDTRTGGATFAVGAGLVMRF
jgi:hypothetical protein